MNSTFEKSSEYGRINFSGFYARNIIANVFALVSIIFLNLITPLEFFRANKTILIAAGVMPILALFWSWALAVILILQFYIQRPISRLKTLVNCEERIHEHILEKAKRRLLNLPILIAAVNLLMFILVPSMVLTLFYHLFDFPFRICLLVFHRVLMIGLIAAALSFFLLEDHARSALVPVLFPKGKLAGLKGTFRISILRRIRFLFAAGTANPMFILLVTLLIILWDVGQAPVPPRELVMGIFKFTIALCGLFIAIALTLNYLVGKSILGPIGEMLRTIEGIRKGNFSKRVKVVSGDELGILGDAGNDMIKGLADRERIRDTFGKYVTPEIRDQILAGKVPLHGERRVATLLFSDLRDFTPFVEENPPEEVIKSMREYFTAMQRAIRDHNGLVLQYVGDEVEAVFGVPLRDEDHADKAVQAALKMRKSLRQLNRERERKGKPPFKHGVGIYTGQVLAGNTGSEDRLSYALIGDTVNLASRIQGLTKSIGCDILVSDETVKALKHAFDLNKEPPQNVKGYSRPITVHSVLGAA